MLPRSCRPQRGWVELATSAAQRFPQVDLGAWPIATWYGAVVALLAEVMSTDDL